MDNTTQHLLWQCYQTPLFLLTQALSCNFSFAIITAHNPAAMLLSPSQNRLLDRQLLREIELLGSPYRALVGAAPDLSHMEKSWAVFIDRTMALQLGKKFNQYAIYVVEQGDVSLVPCLLNGHDEVCLGKFSERVRLVSELPDMRN
ncbi:DUF3293 domain-containing protein [Shewanella morhuae]|uniref:DUF3293 domain-containing protein n=1 Tax=Shewanella morhuae TaxID=365591 RepID=A0A1N6VTV9_9GAMM|nr:DUF3293 domain-containing protein [Shewanella morhuae]PTA51369.1 DUF3293 domain-containing protein [Shewanella morhuae]GIU13350.1 hypothetical protein TUM4641_33040 [Shewanella morhuae]SIQ81244.1 Protein of unknown function [Shewanella morhuae]SUI81740.1 Protein of uncharacterised function (DUF3293) [Shewanella morhuae]